MNRHTVRLSVILVVAFGLKLFHAISTTDDLMFILKPVSFLVGLFQSEQGIQVNEGFLFQQTGILIDKSCAGMNFLIVAWCTLGTLSFVKPTLHLNGILHLLLVALGAYLLTLISNASRIICAIQVIPFRNSMPFVGSSWFHEALGAFVYIVSLIVVTLSLKSIKSINKLRYANIS